MNNYEIYSVYVDGTEVNDTYLTLDRAEDLQQQFLDDGYDNTFVAPCRIDKFIDIVYSYDNPNIPKYIRDLLNTETIWIDEVCEEEYYISYVGLSENFYDFQYSKTLKKQYRAFAKRLHKDIKSIYDLDFTIFIKGYILESDGEENTL